MNVVIPVEDIELPSKPVVLALGKSSSIKATVKPKNATNQKLKWSSSSSKTVSVDKSGKIKALKGGSAWITVKATDGSEVENEVQVKVASMTLKEKKLTLNAGGAAQTIKPTITNDTIASVTAKDKKLVTVTIDKKKKTSFTVKPGNKAGSTKLTIKTKAGISYTLDVKVNKPTTTSLTVSPAKPTIKGIGKQITVKVTAKPSKSVTKEKIILVALKASDKKIISATLNESTGKLTIKAKKPGTANVTVKAGKKTASFKVTVKK